MSLLQIDGLYIAQTNLAGRGVFCIHDIPKGSMIEIAPVIVLSKAQKLLINLTELYNYYFDWDETKESIAIPLGYGGLYNHSKAPNAETCCHLDRSEISFITTKDIPAGKEITINYLGDVDHENGLWFQTNYSSIPK